MILIFAFGSKMSYIDEHLYSESENDRSDIFNAKNVLGLFTFLSFSCDSGIFIFARLISFIKF